MSTHLPPGARAVLANAMNQIQRGEAETRYLRVLGDPILTTATIPVRSITDVGEDLLADMKRIMDASRGVGLAAQQAGSTWRVAIARLEAVNKRDIAVFLNPTIVERSPELELHVREGCLSAPADAKATDYFRTSTRRHAWIVLEHSRFHPVGPGKPAEERRHRIRLEGLDAQVMQHEVDHLDGRCIFTSLPRQQRRQAERGVQEYLRAQGRTQ